jgi:peptidoglycan/xylan/chitin deacetylase (PgdA/CDA1 family)
VSGAAAVVLMYHRVAEAGAAAVEGDYALPRPLFEAQVRWLAASGRPVLALHALLERERPDGGVCLTFDDGCETDATVAGPLLRALRLPAAFFVNPALVGSPGRASWDELRALAEAGFAIGSHGLDHTLLGPLAAGGLTHQLVESRRLIESGLGRPVAALSLPGGSGGARVLRAAREAGYRLVLGSRPGVVRGPAGYAVVPRVALRRGHGLDGFRAAAEQRGGFLLRQQLRFGAAHAGRALVGVRAYGRLRALWLDRMGPAPRVR